MTAITEWGFHDRPATFAWMLGAADRHGGEGLLGMLTGI